MTRHYAEISLDWAHVPSRDELEFESKSTNRYAAARAKRTRSTHREVVGGNPRGDAGLGQELGPTGEVVATSLAPFNTATGTITLAGAPSGILLTYDLAAGPPEVALPVPDWSALRTRHRSSRCR